jgi:hypothetical protein
MSTNHKQGGPARLVRLAMTTTIAAFVVGYVAVRRIGFNLDDPGINWQLSDDDVDSVLGFRAVTTPGEAYAR